MRCFLGIDVPNTLSKKIVDVQNKLRSQSWAIKFVEVSNLHITLKFFGEINENRVKEIKKVIESMHLKKPVLSIKKLGFFSPGYIRVIWLGVEGLENIMSELNKRFGPLKTPHLTIGRVKQIRDKKALITTLKDLENTNIGSFNARRIIMKKSTLTPQGPVYEDLFFVDLV